MSDPGSTSHHQVDANVLLDFADRLHAMRARLEDAPVSVEQRRRWQSRLVAISQGATNDLDRAGSQLRRMAAELDRHGA